MGIIIIKFWRAPLKDFIQTKEPYEALCYLKVVFDKKEYGCCGCLIGPKHMVTAARNVYDPVHVTIKLKIRETGLHR